MNMNIVIYAGNLTADPEVKQTNSGTAVCVLRVASHRKYRVGQEMKEETTYMNVDTFGKSAEACGANLRKGSKVLVEGRLKLKEWVSKDGTKRSSVDIAADRVQFVGDNPGGYKRVGETAPVAADDIPF